MRNAKPPDVSIPATPPGSGSRLPGQGRSARLAGLALAISALTVTSLGAAQQPAYYLKADMVRGAQGAMGPVCVPNSVFFNGEMIVFRMIAYDAATGEEMTFDKVNERGLTASVVIDDVGSFDMFYAPPDTGSEDGPPPADGNDDGSPPGEEGPPPGFDFFRGPVPIPADAPTGTYTWHIVLKDAAGNTSEFQPIIGNVITLLAPE